MRRGAKGSPPHAVVTSGLSCAEITELLYSCQGPGACSLRCHHRIDKQLEMDKARLREGSDCIWVPAAFPACGMPGLGQTATPVPQGHSPIWKFTWMRKARALHHLGWLLCALPGRPA